MKYYSVCLLNYAKDIFQEKLLEDVMDDDNKMNENFEKFLLLTTELLEKGKNWNDEKYFDKKNEELIISYQKKNVDVNVGRVMSKNK